MLILQGLVLQRKQLMYTLRMMMSAGVARD